ncbi:MAG: RNA 2'-phosphotransferase [Gemmataceae bacterium]|nr:RNA 2'-phosphotransferase [Gemmataceae bacterium]MDW8243760.1 RNA 2'-phosphotransferase [Thermogemmata sp.]
MGKTDEVSQQDRGPDLRDLSRAVSHALRHEPWLYGLELDAEGWACVDELVAALRRNKPEWVTLSVDDLTRMIATSDKQRHEIRGGKIRALYGHSIPGKLRRTPMVPPEVFYHGTSPLFVPAIRTSGLLPMARQYVHLSVDVDTALAVGKRKSKTPIILRVQAKQAYEKGVQFYIGNEKVWLVDRVPSDFIVFPGE